MNHVVEPRAPAPLYVAMNLCLGAALRWRFSWWRAARWFALGVAAHGALAATYHVAKSGDDGNSGDEASPFLTIQRAADVMQAGDTVIVHAGVYREWVKPVRGGVEGERVTYRAAPGELVAIKGSEVLAGPFTPVGVGVFAASLEGVNFSSHWHDYREVTEVPMRTEYNPFALPAHGVDGTLGQVFVNGERLTEFTTRTEVQRAPGSWRATSGGAGIEFNPPPGVDLAGALVEVTVRERIFCPDVLGLKYITLSGFLIEHAANQHSKFGDDPRPQHGAVGTRRGFGWVIENNVIRHAQNIGLDIGCEMRPRADDDMREEGVGGHLIRNNIISDNGLCGLAGSGHYGTDVIGNIFERNGWRYAEWLAEDGGVKFHWWQGGRIEGNLFRHNGWRALWIDWWNRDNRVARNVFVGNSYRGHGWGIWFEFNEGPIEFVNNVIFDRDVLRGKGQQRFLDAHNFTVGVYHSFTGDRREWLGVDGEPMDITVRNNILAGGAINWDDGARNVSDWNLFSQENQRSPAGQDKNSAHGGIQNIELDEETLVLSFEAGEAYARMACPPVKTHGKSGREGVVTGYFGAEIGEFARPGPFQTVSAGRNTFRLWPVPGAAFDPDLLPSGILGPAAPADFRAMKLNPERIELAWADATNQENGFAVERRAAGRGDWTEIAKLGFNKTIHTDREVEAGAAYEYRVRAFNSLGSSYSRTVLVAGQ